ncbi:hypothetical protein Pelo_8456 [Pelomyxa schiedti]|nr:hypothetical protein Pelo_8456 [Pelomyxa schiedti]
MSAIGKQLHVTSTAPYEELEEWFTVNGTPIAKWSPIHNANVESGCIAGFITLYSAAHRNAIMGGQLAIIVYSKSRKMIKLALPNREIPDNAPIGNEDSSPRKPRKKVSRITGVTHAPELKQVRAERSQSAAPTSRSDAVESPGQPFLLPSLIPPPYASGHSSHRDASALPVTLSAFSATSPASSRSTAPSFGLPQVGYSSTSTSAPVTLESIYSKLLELQSEVRAALGIPQYPQIPASQVPPEL